MAVSVTAANKSLEAQFGKSTYTAAATQYIGLSSTPPSTTGTNITEPTDGGYARQPVTAATWANATGGSISNANAITFQPATTNYGGATLGYWFLATTLTGTGSDVVVSSALQTPVSVTANVDTLSFAPGTLTASLS